METDPAKGNPKPESRPGQSGRLSGFSLVQIAI